MRAKAHSYRFGAFAFDADSGELRRLDSAAPPARLPPQPARLLALLADKNGEVVTREEIRERIWSGVEVEFDTSLHFCIRQIRAALGDSASGSRYVETLPRRGYRLIPEVETSSPAGATPADRGRRGWWRAGGATVLVGAAAAAALLLSGGRSGPANADPLRIAVMPFRPPAVTPFGEIPPIAEWIVEDLTHTAGPRAAIIGPTTTTGYDGTDAAIARLAADYDLDYVVNGRFLDDGRGARMLAELIRVSDGAHTWVEAYHELDDGRRIGREISAGVVRELGLGRSGR
ncbi:MAG TPA: winged helix-turn-helix domain-containing protein [Candidatus Polarisedimenticolaceae bacterium]|nr:winged helix-turn-helix domain-containing protein [Candidatus Polarisedimenticolaceae bacterium]